MVTREQIEQARIAVEHAAMKYLAAEPGSRMAALNDWQAAEGRLRDLQLTAWTAGTAEQMARIAQELDQEYSK